MKLLYSAALSLAILFLSTVAAFAADTTISIGWGDALGAVLPSLAEVAVIAIIGLLIKVLPAPLQAYLTAQRIAQVEQLLGNAVNYGVNVVTTATKDKAVTIDVHNEMVAEALQYALDHGPEKLIDWMGGLDAVKQKIIARLPPLPSV
jgi:hypothetical protein